LFLINIFSDYKNYFINEVIIGSRVKIVVNPSKTIIVIQLYYFEAESLHIGPLLLSKMSIKLSRLAKVSIWIIANGKIKLI